MSHPSISRELQPLARPQDRNVESAKLWSEFRGGNYSWRPGSGWNSAWRDLR